MLQFFKNLNVYCRSYWTSLVTSIPIEYVTIFQMQEIFLKEWPVESPFSYRMCAQNRMLSIETQLTIKCVYRWVYFDFMRMPHPVFIVLLQSLQSILTVS